MKLNVTQLGFALGITWALLVFSVGVANLFWPCYGVAFLKIADSIYPGYHLGKWGLGGVFIAAVYSVIDGFIVGIIFAWLYNLCGKCKKEKDRKRNCLFRIIS